MFTIYQLVIWISLAHRQYQRQVLSTAMVIPARLMIFKDGQSLRWYGRYPRLTVCELEHGHRDSWFTMIYPLNMVLFRSYVTLPEVISSKKGFYYRVSNGVYIYIYLPTLPTFAFGMFFGLNIGKYRWTQTKHSVGLSGGVRRRWFWHGLVVQKTTT